MINWRTLQGNRIKFEPLSESILDDFHSYLSDEDVSRYIGWPLTHTIDESKAYLDKLFDDEKKGTHEYASMVLDGKHIGTMMFFNFAKEAKNLEVGYVVSKDYWGHGYTTEAMELVMSYLKLSTDYHKVYARVVGGNSASSKVLEKVGFRLEGQLVDQYLVDQTYHDALYYGVIFNR